MTVDYADLERRILADFTNWLSQSGKLTVSAYSHNEIKALLEEYDAARMAEPLSVIYRKPGPLTATRASEIMREKQLWPLKYGMGADKLGGSATGRLQSPPEPQSLPTARPPHGAGNALGERQRHCDYCGVFHPVGVLEDGLCPTCVDLDGVQSLMDRDRE